MLKIGITGGIGSGKTTIATIFAALEIPIYNADNEAKKIMNTDEAVRNLLIKAFGEAVYNAQGINNTLLRSIVFNDVKSLARLNDIVHPFTIAHFQNWASEKKKFPFIIKEAALLFETQAHHDLDLIIGVFCNSETRIKRLISRGINDIDLIKKIMSQQIPDNIKMKLCDMQIDNNDNAFVLQQVLECFDRLSIKSFQN